MKAARGVGWAGLFGIFFCVWTAAAQPAPKVPPTTCTNVPTPTDPDAIAQARRLYAEGKTSAEAGDWQAAYTSQRAAYAWFPHGQIAGALGDAAFVLGKFPEAIEMLSQGLCDQKSFSVKERADAEKRLAEAKGKCGSLAIDAPAGTEAKIDGAPAVKLPLGKDLYVLPGAHTVEVVSSTGTVKQTVDVTAGKISQVTVTPAVVTAPAVAAAPASQAPAGSAPAFAPMLPVAPPATPSPTHGPLPTPEARPSLVPAIVLGVGSAAALGAGFGIFAFSELKGGEATHARTAYDQLSLDQKTDLAKKQVGDLLREQDALITGAVAAWIGAGVLGTGAIVYAAYRSHVGRKAVEQTPVPRTSIRWVPSVTPQSAGMIVQGSF